MIYILTKRTHSTICELYMDWYKFLTEGTQMHFLLVVEAIRTFLDSRCLGNKRWVLRCTQFWEELFNCG